MLFRSAEPAYYLPASSYNYGVGGFLLAASELKTMTQTTTRTETNTNTKISKEKP